MKIHTVILLCNGIIDTVNTFKTGAKALKNISALTGKKFKTEMQCIKWLEENQNDKQDIHWFSTELK